MNLSLLKKYFSGEIQPSELIEEIKDEVEIYNSRLQKKGSSVPVYLSENTHFGISPRDVIKMCQAFKNNQLQASYIDYICTALQFAEEVEFESEDIADAIATMTDPEINGALTSDMADEIIESLS